MKFLFLCFSALPEVNPIYDIRIYNCVHIFPYYIFFHCPLPLSSVLYISFILTCTYTCVFVDERRFLRPCYTVKQVSRYLYHATFCIVILVSLHTKSSSMFHAECLYKLFPPKWRNLTMKTLSYKLKRLSICSFDQITSLLFPLSSHVLFTMC